jgi:hypothetical protein
MISILLALGTRAVTPGLPDPYAMVVSFAAALAGTTAVGWWASRLESLRIQREQDALLAATPAAGVH